MISQHGNETTTVFHGDCLQVLTELPDASVDLVLEKPIEKTPKPQKPTQALATLVSANMPPAATAAAAPAAVPAPAPQTNIWVGAIAALALIFVISGLIILRKR